MSSCVVSGFLPAANDEAEKKEKGKDPLPQTSPKVNLIHYFLGRINITGDTTKKEIRQQKRRIRRKNQKKEEGELI